MAVKHAPLTAVVLAGGQGSRMGGPKAEILLKGKPLLQHVIDSLLPVTDHLIVVGSEAVRLPTIPYPDLAFLTDAAPDEGPLRAAATAFRSINTELTLVVGCDMPFLNAALIAFLAGLATGHDVVVPVVEAREQPLHAVYRTHFASLSAENALTAGERRMRSLLLGRDVRRVERPEWSAFDPLGRSFENLNTPDDLAAAETRT
jgi:molybdenum cofactor guanylyltransferase